MKTLLLLSKYAFYPPHWQAFTLICERYGVQGAVISDRCPELPSVHRQLGWIDADAASGLPFVTEIAVAPDGGSRARGRWLAATLDRIRPDAIWLQQEPVERLSLELLEYYRSDSHPKIASAVCENIFKRRLWWKRMAMSKRWARLDGLLATAQGSVQGIQHAGMPHTVPATTLVAGMEGPPSNVPAMDLGFVAKPSDFIVGFAGRICEEKGWHHLLDAVQRLPDRFKVAFAGDGPQSQELVDRSRSGSLAGRVSVLGALPKQQLWSFYRALNCLVLPSMTRGKWKEQFGGVLADAMAMGLPIIGSDSGSIPEVVGPAGVIVPEGRSDPIAEAIHDLSRSEGLLERLGNIARRRYESEFSIEAYAAKIATVLELNRSSHIEQKVA